MPKLLREELEHRILLPHVWEWFWDIASAAPESGISYQELLAFQMVRGIRLTYGEILIIRALDRKLRKSIYERQMEQKTNKEKDTPKTLGRRS